MVPSKRFHADGVMERRRGDVGADRDRERAVFHLDIPKRGENFPATFEVAFISGIIVHHSQNEERPAEIACSVPFRIVD